MKILLLIQKSPSKERCRQNKCGLFQIHLGGLRVSATSGKFDYLYSYLSLETVSPALKLTQNCYINVNIFFLKTSNLFLNWVPSLFSYNHLIPERISSKSILSNSLLTGEQIESTTWAYVKKKKKSVFFFLIWEKLRSPSRATFKNSKISLWIAKNLEVQPKPNSQNYNLESTDELGKVRS